MAFAPLRSSRQNTSAAVIMLLGILGTSQRRRHAVVWWL
jgi:hypothetical protein